MGLQAGCAPQRARVAGCGLSWPAACLHTAMWTLGAMALESIKLSALACSCLTALLHALQASAGNGVQLAVVGVGGARPRAGGRR